MLVGALSALAVMTVLSTALGLVVPNLISKDTVNKAGTTVVHSHTHTHKHDAYSLDSRRRVRRKRVLLTGGVNDARNRRE